MQSGSRGPCACMCVQVLPAMLQAGKGTIIFTGATASIRGGAKFASLACPKFALRALAQSLAREFQPQVMLSSAQPHALTFLVVFGASSISSNICAVCRAPCEGDLGELSEESLMEPLTVRLWSLFYAAWCFWHAALGMISDSRGMCSCRGCTWRMPS